VKQSYDVFSGLKQLRITDGQDGPPDDDSQGRILECYRHHFNNADVQIVFGSDLGLPEFGR
jgi:hypothetical protein